MSVIHIIVPGGGLGVEGQRRIACRPGFFLPVKVLSRLFRRLFPTGLQTAHRAGRLRFFGDRANLANPDAFAAHIAPLRRTEWAVCAKPPSGGPEAVPADLSRHTHRVAISNSRPIAADARSVTFRWKDCRAGNRDRQKLRRLETAEFIRRFPLHVLPTGFHRIRHAACPGPDPGGFSQVRRANGTSRPSGRCSRRHRWRPTPTPGTAPRRRRQDRCVNPVPIAAGTCASSRPSPVVRRLGHERHQREPRHDAEIKTRPDTRSIGTLRRSMYLHAPASPPQDQSAPRAATAEP